MEGSTEIARATLTKIITEQPKGTATMECLEQIDRRHQAEW